MRLRRPKSAPEAEFFTRNVGAGEDRKFIGVRKYELNLELLAGQSSFLLIKFSIGTDKSVEA